MTGGSGILVAVVDDDASIRKAVSSLVRSAGHTARMYESGEDFLADDTLPPADCLLTDIQMPGMNGLELQLAVAQRFPGLPVIIMTAFPKPILRSRALAAGAARFLSKPFPAEELLEVLAEVAGPPA